MDVVTGDLGRVARFVRPAGRCPACEFLDDCEKPMRNRFRGAFQAIVIMGQKYQVSQRFTPLHGPGRPLWEFKEHDHRLYCVRNVLDKQRVEVILLNGWVKDKRGKSDEENRKIETAQLLHREYLTEAKGGRR